MLDYLQELKSLAGDIRSIECPTVQDWRAFESEVGVVLPSAHKDIVSAFGNGRFGEGIRFMNPCSRGEFRYRKELVEAYMANAGMAMDFIEKGFWRKLFPEKRDGYLFVGASGLQIDFFIDLGNSGDVVVVSFQEDLALPLDMDLQRFIYELYAKKLDGTETLKYLRESNWPYKKTPFFTPEASR